MEENLYLMDGPFMNTLGEIIPFWGFDSQFSIIHPSQMFF